MIIFFNNNEIYKIKMLYNNKLILVELKNNNKNINNIQIQLVYRPQPNI